MTWVEWAALPGLVWAMVVCFGVGVHGEDVGDRALKWCGILAFWALGFALFALTSVRVDHCADLYRAAQSRTDSLIIVSVHEQCLWERADTVGLGEIGESAALDRGSPPDSAVESEAEDE